MAVSTALITTYAGSALNLAIPSLGDEFAASASGLTWIVNAYVIASVCLALPFGKIADTVSRRTVLLTGCALYLLFSTLAVFCPSLPLMLVLRVGQGSAAAMLFATNIAILVDAFPPGERGKVMGFYTAATYGGVSLGPVLGGILTDAFGWRSVFVSMALICVAALVFSAVFVKPDKKEPRKKETRQGFHDWLGVGLFIAAFALLLCGFSAIDDLWAGPVLAALGVAGVALFCVVETRSQNPLIDVRIFARNKNFALSNLAAMFNYAATFAVSYLMSIYLQEVKGMTARAAGLFMICQPVVQAIISPLSGRMADKHSPFVLASAGMAVCTAALVCFAFFGIDTRFPFILAVLLLTGVGFGLFSSPNQTAIMSSVGASDYSMASSLIATSRNIGDVLSMALIALITNIWMGGESLEAASKGDIVGSFRAGFIVFSAICAIGVFISLQRKSRD
jgi:EmrB/QacA subfamily drug resistance transporter